MSHRLKRPLCSACLHFSRRRLYASQAVLLHNPNSRRPDYSREEQPNNAGPSSLTLVAPKLSSCTHDQDTFPQVDANQQLQRATEPHGVDFTIPRNPLEPNKVDLYLSSLRAAGREPTLADIERCRPHGHSHPSSPQYTQDYKALLDLLCRSFSKAQFRRFAELYSLPKTRSMRKQQYAENIIEIQWKWPSLKDVERRKRDATEVSSKCKYFIVTKRMPKTEFLTAFEVTPSQLFLILGKGVLSFLRESVT